VGCGVLGDQLIGPYILPQLLTWYLQHRLQDELPAVLENVPLQTRCQMCYKHDGAPPHFTQVIWQYLNQISQIDGLVAAVHRIC
jgi:hypothetical protein